jgi:L-fuconolactonase
MIDAHHHFWWTGRHAYTWPDQVGDRFARDFTPDDLRPELARAGVKGTVLIQVLHQVGGETEEASLIFCYIGVPNVEASGNVWLTKEHEAFVAPSRSSGRSAPRP